MKKSLKLYLVLIALMVTTNLSAQLQVQIYNSRNYSNCLDKPVKATEWDESTIVEIIVIV